MMCVAVCFLSGSLSGQSNQDNLSISSLPKESVFIHTDKPYYLTGETLWFTGYCMEEVKGVPTYLSSVLYVELLDKDQIPIAQLKCSLSSGVATGQILISPTWSTGNYILRAYTAWMRNGDEAQFYHQSITIVNPLTVLSPEMLRNDSTSYGESETVDSANNWANLIEIQTDDDRYSFRQLISLKLKPIEAANSPMQLSVSVYPYHDALEYPGFRHGHLAEVSKSTSDLDNVEPQYFPETSGLVLYGRSEQVSPSGLKLSIKGQAARIYTPLFLDSVNFAIQLPPRAKYEDLVFWSSKKDGVKVTPYPAFDGRPFNDSIRTPTFDRATIEFIEGQSLNMQVSNLYQDYNHIHGRPDSLKEVGRPFYGTPDFKYDLDDYTRFPKMEEVFREYVNKVSIRKKAGYSQLYVWDQYSNDQSIANNIYFGQPALVLIDGMPVGSVDSLMTIDPLRIKSIEVLNKRYFIGEEEFYGIVNLMSYEEDFTGMEPFFDLELVSYDGIDPTNSFHHPDHGSASKKSKIPDRRNTLYWNNQVIIKDNMKELKFYAADVAGDYQVVVKGQTADGRLINGKKKITVLERSTP